MATTEDNKSSLKDICQELDLLSIRILQLMNDLVLCKLNMEKTMKEGNLDLAKARYIMGNRSVSALQLPTEDGSEISALATVTSSDDSSNNLGNLVYQLQCTTLVSPNDRQKSPRSSVKQRSLKEYDDPKGSDGEDEPLIHGSSSKSSDPLKWFGVLVPQPLRLAQTRYVKAIELAVQSVNIQSELEASRVRFQKLLKQKSYTGDVREP